jgi:hypothetical protein
VILRGFAEFTAQCGTAFASHQYDTTPFYEDMRGHPQTGFTKSHLIEKLRRLKRKYRNCVDRLRVARPNFYFRSPQEQAIFEVARAIWRPASDNNGRDSDNDVDARLDGESARSPSSRSHRPCHRRAADFKAADVAEALPLPPVPAMTTEDTLPSFPQPTAMDPAAAVSYGCGRGNRREPHPGVAVPRYVPLDAEHQLEPDATGAGAAAHDPWDADGRGEVAATADPGAAGVPTPDHPAPGPGASGAGRAQIRTTASWSWRHEQHMNHPSCFFSPSESCLLANLYTYKFLKILSCRLVSFFRVRKQLP